ncbi:autotransporter domain-containing protein [Variovorax sp. PvP013]|uniref:autotransporter domain-containing protein n=1 Tax=Variovorax sp. PvP013 TaxID=3156435 RepID=UPI003D25915D
MGQYQNGSGTVLVDGIGSTLKVKGQVVLGDSGNGSMVVSNGGQASAGESIFVGDRTGGTGTLTVTDAGSSLTTGGDLQVGSVATGSMTVTDGAKVSVDRDAYVGLYAGADGTLTVTRSATFDVLTGAINVGDSGTGRMTVSNGGKLNTVDMLIGNQAEGKGDVTVSAAGSRISAHRDLVVGGKGLGTLSVLAGAGAETGNVYVGERQGGTGTVRVDGRSDGLRSRLRADVDIHVGESGHGSMVVSGGGSASALQNIVVANNSASVGDVTVTGAGSTLGAAGSLVVGNAGTGKLSVLGGAQADAQSTSIGQAAGGVGTVTVDSAGSTLEVQRTLQVGVQGNASLSVSGGAQATVGASAVVGADAPGTGTVQIGGATSSLTTTGSLRIGGSGHGVLSIADGGGLTVQQDLVVADVGGSQGQLNVTGAGSRTVTAGGLQVGSSGTGTMTVDGGAQASVALDAQVGANAGGSGSLAVTGASSAFAVAGALQVGPSGNGALDITNGAQVTSATTSLGSNAGATGTAVLAGAGSSLTTGDVFLGRNDLSDPSKPNGGTASLTVTDAATLRAGTVSVAVTTGSIGTLNIGADAASAAAAPGTIDAKNIVFGQGDGALVLNHTAQDYSFAPTIDGTGRVQALSGTTTLASGNTYTGGTSITGTTTLKGSATSFGSGAIQNNGALVLDQPADAAFANVMAGTGALTKTGAGLLNVTGDSSGFTGATSVAAGRLAVNGSLSGSAVTVQSGATLSGAGTVGSVRAQSGATVAPGNSPGTLSVAGDYHQAAGATYAAELVPGSTVSDRIAVGGTATLDGGAVIHVAKYGTGGYTPGTRYTVLSAAGGVKGTYTLTGETDVSAFYALGATYDANHVYLDTVQVRPLAAAAATINQTAAARGVQGLPLVKGLPTAIGSLRTDADARRAFDQLSGELHASVRTVFLEDSRFVREATRRQVHASGGEDRKDSGESVWAHAYGASGRYDGDGNAAGLQRDIGGLFAGTDAAVSADTRLGIVGGYGRSRITLQESRGSATVDTYGLGLYGATQWDRTRASYGVNEAWHKLSTSRSVGLEGFADQLSADYRARSTQLYGDVGYRMGAELGLAPAALEPFASLAWVDLRTSGTQERGGAAALGVAKGSTRVGFATLGLRSAATLDIGGVPVVASALLGWRGVLGGTTPSSANGFAGGTGAAGFVVQGVPLARNVAALEANVSAALTPTLTLGLAYAGQIGPGFSDHGIRASLALKF